MLQRLPGDDIPQHVEAPALETGEVHVGGPIVEVERPSDEALLAALACLPEAFECLRLRADRGLVRAGEVDAAEKESTTSVVDELGVRGVDEVGGDGLARGGRQRGNARHVVVVSAVVAIVAALVVVVDEVDWRDACCRAPAECGTIMNCLVWRTMPV